MGEPRTERQGLARSWGMLGVPRVKAGLQWGWGVLSFITEGVSGGYCAPLQRGTQI